MKIVVAAGGTAGHLIPALEVARQLKREGHTVSFMGVLGRCAPQLLEEGFACQDFTARGLQGQGIVKDVTAAFSLVGAAWKARSFLIRDRPDVIAGFGGYGSFPAVCAGLSCRIPTVIHEQNVMPGRANRLLARMVKKVAVTFRGTRAYLPGGNVVVTGCPIDPIGIGESSLELSRAWGFENDRRTVLVFGGSQGSDRINTVFPECVPLVDKDIPVQIIHIAGRGRLLKLNEAYRGIDVPYKLLEFYRPMAALYALADVAVCRSGAATVTELVYFGLPAVLIPYPYAHGHQQYNAKVLVDGGVGQMILDGEVTSQNLAERLVSVLRQPSPAENFRRLGQELNINHATSSLAREILTTV